MNKQNAVLELSELTKIFSARRKEGDVATAAKYVTRMVALTSKIHCEQTGRPMKTRDKVTLELRLRALARSRT
jgi:hypothetical protein